MVEDGSVTIDSITVIVFTPINTFSGLYSTITVDQKDSPGFLGESSDLFTSKGILAKLTLDSTFSLFEIALDGNGTEEIFDVGNIEEIKDAGNEETEIADEDFDAQLLDSVERDILEIAELAEAAISLID